MYPMGIHMQYPKDKYFKKSNTKKLCDVILETADEKKPPQRWFDQFTLGVCHLFCTCKLT